MKIPEEYTPQEKKAYQRGYLDRERGIYSSNGKKGGYSLWASLTLEQRKAKIDKMNAGRKKPIDSACSHS